MKTLLNKLFKTAILTIIFINPLTCNAQLLQQTQMRHGCTVAEQIENSPLFNPHSIVEELLDFALTYQGVPYRYGSMGPQSFDCSGFTSYIFKRHGYQLHRTAAGQYNNGNAISRGEEQPGDLVFFGGKRNGRKIGHVGIVVTRNETGFNFIHASCSRGVTISHSEEKYYKIRYKGACRVINTQPRSFILLHD